LCRTSWHGKCLPSRPRTLLRTYRRDRLTLLPHPLLASAQLLPRTLLPALAVFLWTISGHASLPTHAPGCSGAIEQIRFTGNKVTRERVLRQLSGLRVGQLCSREVLAEASQSIMNSGLFKRVRSRFDTATATAEFSVSERYYTLPIPRLDRTADGELRIGGQLRLDNVFGLNHRFAATARREVEDDGKGNGGNRLQLSYDIPRLTDSRYGVYFDMGALDKTESVMKQGRETGLVGRREGSLGVNLSRYFSTMGALQGWRTVVGVGVVERRYDLIKGSASEVIRPLTH